MSSSESSPATTGYQVPHTHMRTHNGEHSRRKKKGKKKNQSRVQHHKRHRQHEQKTTKNQHAHTPLGAPRRSPLASSKSLPAFSASASESELEEDEEEEEEEEEGDRARRLLLLFFDDRLDRFFLLELRFFLLELRFFRDDLRFLHKARKRRTNKDMDHGHGSCTTVCGCAPTLRTSTTWNSHIAR
jgi:hypothetical protein